MDKKDVSIVICCAGMGTRLGIGTTKALVNVQGKPLIIRLLEMMNDYDDVRIVVGYQAEKVIKIVNSYRKDIMFAFNYDYKTTGTLQSVNKGIKNPRKYTVIMGGDFLIEPKDFYKFMSLEGNYVAYTRNISSEPIYVEVNESKIITSFSKVQGNAEWSGLVCLKSNLVNNNWKYVYQVIEELLPINSIEINSIDIDTQEDYEIAVNWLNNSYKL